MNKRQAKKKRKFKEERNKNIIYNVVPSNWSEIRWAKQIKEGKLKI